MHLSFHSSICNLSNDSFIYLFIFIYIILQSIYLSTTLLVLLWMASWPSITLASAVSMWSS